MIRNMYDQYRDKTNELLEYGDEKEIRDRENVLYGMFMVIDLLERMEEIERLEAM